MYDLDCIGDINKADNDFTVTVDKLGDIVGNMNQSKVMDIGEICSRHWVD